MRQSALGSPSFIYLCAIFKEHVYEMYAQRTWAPLISISMPNIHILYMSTYEIYARERIWVPLFYISLPNIQKICLYAYEMYAQRRTWVPLFYISLPNIQRICIWDVCESAFGPSAFVYVCPIFIIYTHKHVMNARERIWVPLFYISLPNIQRICLYTYEMYARGCT